MKTLTRVARVGVVTAALLASSLFLSFINGDDTEVKAKWTAMVIHTADGQADVHFTAEIPKGWRMYSQSMKGKDGVLATDVQFDPDPKYNTVGKVDESGKKVSFYQSEVGMQVTCLEDRAEYVQHITFTEGETFSIKCMIDYMLNRDGDIQPPSDEDFTITVEPN